MKRRFSIETKVGFFLVVLFLLIAWISLRLGNYGLTERLGYTVSAVFDSAAGLDPESKVLLAGIRVGRIERIVLEGGKARVDMRINPGVDLEKDVKVQIMSQGLLGAKYLEIQPGTPGAELLKPGDFIQKVDQPLEISRMADEVGLIMDDIKAITESLRNVLGTDEGERGIQLVFENLQDITSRLSQIALENQRNLALTISNLEKLSASMARISNRNEERLARTMEVLPDIAESLRIVSENLSDILEKNNQDIQETLANIQRATDSLDDSLESIASIAGKIDEGEGTLGRLVNDDRTIKEINDAVEGVNDFLARARRTRAFVSYNAEYLFDADYTKHYVSLQLWPTMNQYYMLGLVDDRFGRTQETDTRTETVTNPDTDEEEREVEEEHKEVTRDNLLISAQIARRYWDFVLRGGIIESTGGAGFDFYLWDDRIRFSVDAFDWSTDENPHLKAGLYATFFNNFVLAGGVDDFVQEDEDPFFWLGGGIVISDDNIKTLLSTIPLSSF